MWQTAEPPSITRSAQPCPKPPSRAPWYKSRMPSFRVETPQRCYSAIVERGIVAQPRRSTCRPRPARSSWSPPRTCGGTRAAAWTGALAGVPHEVLFLPGGEDQKRLAPLERLAEEMVRPRRRPHQRGGRLRRRHRHRYGRIPGRHLHARHPACCRSPPRCWPRWTPPSAARPASTWRAART